MIELEGKYNSAKVFIDYIDSSTEGQIKSLLNQEYLKDSIIRFMPDCHAGKGATVGTVMSFNYKLPVGLLGNDLGCGIMAIKLKNKSINFSILDKVIRTYIPYGRNVHKEALYVYKELYKNIKADIDQDKANKSLGTLGGGNHFIEVDIDSDDNYWMLIHSGSRYLGTQVSTYYKELAWLRLKENILGGSLKDKTKELTESLSGKKLNKALKELKDTYKNIKPDIPYELAYLEDKDMIDYLSDLSIVQEYAELNRRLIYDAISHAMDLKSYEDFQTVHNYIDIYRRILRKGSISAEESRLAVIPLNMRDGALLVKGKGNEDWLYSAPHGAGRSLSRQDAKNSISMKDYKDSMNGIFTTCISKDTVDESCFAYKDPKDIINNIQDTVEVIDKLTPVYNFKASE